jgi:uncharacterized membrane protein YqjE
MASSAQSNEAKKISTVETARQWLADLLHYLELKLRLLGIESKSAGLHLLGLVLLFAATVVFFSGALMFAAVFLLFILMQFTHWAWGWCSLLCTGVLLVLSLFTGLILRFRIVKPIFSITLAELRKDREWLARTKKSDS